MPRTIITWLSVEWGCLNVPMSQYVGHKKNYCENKKGDQHPNKLRPWKQEGCSASHLTPALPPWPHGRLPPASRAPALPEPATVGGPGPSNRVADKTSSRARVTSSKSVRKTSSGTRVTLRKSVWREAREGEYDGGPGCSPARWISQDTNWDNRKGSKISLSSLGLQKVAWQRVFI